MDYNPDKRFILKAESITLIEDFEIYLFPCNSHSHTHTDSTALTTSVTSLIQHFEETTIEEDEKLTTKTETRIEIEHKNGNEKGIENEKNESTVTIQADIVVEDKIGVGGEEDCANKLGKKVETEVDNGHNEKSMYTNTYKMIVSHGDCVQILPKKSILLGSSMSCTNEAYVTGVNNNIFACQSHPEFHYQYSIQERIWNSVVILNKKLNENEIKVAENSFENYTRTDSDNFLEIIKNFFNVPCPNCAFCRSQKTDKISEV